MPRQKRLEGPRNIKGSQAWRSWAPSELFYHRPDHGVLICTACHYAVQPGAIWRHLKDIHHLRQGERGPYIDYTKGLKLKKPEEVRSPSPDEFPVQQLPVEKGWRCLATGCNYMCTSTKRMENHWPAVHARKGTAGVDWDYVLLQTFFRGKMLRYFTGQKKQDLSAIQAKQNTIVKLQKSPISQSQQGETSILKQMQERYHLDLLDSQLLEHYFDSSYKTFVTNKKTEKVWIKVVPGLAYSHKFLFQGILACTALHLAYKNPLERQKYTLRGCCHQDSAIPEFRQAIETPTEENCDAIIAFAYLLVVYSLATDLEYTAHSLLIVNPNPLNTQQILPPWLHFIRTGCHMLKDVWHRIESGRASVLAAAWERNLNITIEERQHHLEFFLSIIPNDGSWSSESIRLYHNAANVLAESFAYVDRAKGTIGITAWNILGTWPVRIEEGFFTMTSEKHPGALILLAYYCVLLKQIEECWYFGGRPAQMITFIAQILDKKWIPYIADAIDGVLGPGSKEFMRSLPLH